MAATKAVQRLHWYRIVTEECPVCGKVDGYRERVEGKPPKNDADRYVYEQVGCAGTGCYSWL